MTKATSIDFWHQLKFKDHGLVEFTIQLYFSINQNVGTVKRSLFIVILLYVLLETGVVREQVFGTATFYQLQFIRVDFFHVPLILLFHSGTRDGSVRAM